MSKLKRNASVSQFLERNDKIQRSNEIGGEIIAYKNRKFNVDANVKFLTIDVNTLCVNSP